MYEFGLIVIDGKEYRADVIVLPSGVQSGWWRREGHSLVPEDLGAVVGAAPEILVVGTGAYGVMTVPALTKSFLENKNIKMEAYPTRRAVARYNELAAAGVKVAAALHLTC